MNLEPIQEKHLDACAELFVRVFNDAPWNESWSLDSVRKRLGDYYRTPGFMGVLSDDDGLLGFALGNMEDWNNTKHFLLKEMCVQSEQQRRGLGSRLLGHLEARVKEGGGEKIYLLTARDGSAEAFYRKNGFYVSPKMVMMGKYLEAPKGSGSKRRREDKDS